jgi:hypothetical protein
MKRMIQLLSVGATVAMLALPLAAKTMVLEPSSLFQDQCTQENKDAFYATFREVRKTDEAKAYDAAKKYLACAGSEDTDITKYLKKWVGSYEEVSQKQKLPTLIYTAKDYPGAFAYGKELLAKDPENLKALIDLGYAGYLASVAKNNSFNADAINYAKKAIQLLESGKTVDAWAPFANKDEALAYLNYSIGALTVTHDPSSALSYLIKAATFESTLKKVPYTYSYIAGAYETGPYAKQSADYQTKYQGKDETPESKLALANINQIVDRMVDAYARAVAAAGSDSAYTKQKPEWQESLSTWYKYRHDKSEAGMPEMVASILSKPLPPEPTPLTSLPASSPAATPASGTGTGATPTNGTAAGMSPASTTQPVKTAPPAAGNKPAATVKTNAPAKPRGK